LPTGNHFDAIAAQVAPSSVYRKQSINELLDHMDLSLDVPIDVVVNMMTRTEKPAALCPDVVENDGCGLFDRGATK
jgi:hypothetical protein